MKLKKILYKISGGWTFLRTNLVINVTNICDRSCLFCPYQSHRMPMNYHRVWFLSQPDYLSYFDCFKFFKHMGIMRKLIRNVAITGKGEPFMHPYIWKIITMIDEYKIPFSITSNGHDNLYGMIDKVLNVSRLTHVRISLYDMAQWDKWKSIKHPKLKFFNMTGKEINGITTGYISSAYGVDHKRALKDFNKTDFCSAPFYFITINTDGSVVPCYSFDEIGNMSDGFLRLWNGYKIRQYRRNAVNGRNIILADCDNCGINYRVDDKYQKMNKYLKHNIGE